MKRRLVRAVLGICIGIFAAACSHTSALAACTMPNLLTNGQTADASQVMADLNAVAGCADASIKPSGTPSVGAVAAFSSSTQITNATAGPNTVLGNPTGSTATVQASTLPNCTDANGQHLNYVAGSGFSCGSSGTGGVKMGAGPPAPSADQIGTLYAQTDAADLYQQVVPSTSTLSVLQAASAAGTTSVTLGATPIAGDLLVAGCSGYTGVPSANTGWTQVLSAGPHISDPGDIWVYKTAVLGESTSQTPCAGGSRPTVVVFEVAGAIDWNQSFEGTATTDSSPISYTTTHNNDVVLGAVYNQANADPGAPTIASGLSGTPTSAHAGGGSGIAAASGAFASSGSTINMSWSAGGIGALSRLVVLKPPTSGWQKLSRLARIQNAGTDISTEPVVINCSTGMTCTKTASPSGPGDAITLTAVPTTNSVPLSALASQSANTVVGNFTGSTGNVAANAMPNCSDSGGAHLNYVSGSGITCGASYNTSQTLSGLTLSGITGATQCLHVNTSGVISGTGSDCGAGSGTVVAPQGRLTLTSNTPVMTADATAQSTIYYANYVGSLLPIGNAMYRVGQLSYALNATAHASGNLYDIGVFNNSGTVTLCTAPAWTNSTTRSATISQDATTGIWENSASLTCNLSGGTTTTAVAAGQWTYLGTFYATANGQTGMAFQPAAAAGGANPIMGLWNAYNRVRVACLNRDSTASWTYSTATWRASDGSNNNRCSYVDGLGQSAVSGALVETTTGGASGTVRVIGLGRDSTTATPQASSQAVGSNTIGSTIADSWAPALGFHYVTAMEAAGGGGTATWLGLQTAPSRQLHALSVGLEM